jgi:hypothetical protein
MEGCLYGAFPVHRYRRRRAGSVPTSPKILRGSHATLSGGPMSARLIVDRLPAHWRDEDGFGTFGRIQSIHIVRDRQGHSLNFGYVEMEQLEAASRALSALNGKELPEASLTVSLAQ